MLIDGISGPSGGGAAAAVIGFGINHAPVDGVPPAAGGSLGATSLTAESPAPPTLGDLVWELVEAVAGELAAAADDLVDRYRALSVHRVGDRVRCRTAAETLEGVFRGFDERGFLRLELTAAAASAAAGEEVRVSAGEVMP